MHYTAVVTQCVIALIFPGGYFRSFDDALKLHGQLSKVGQLLSNAEGLTSTTGAAKNATLFVPGKHRPCCAHLLLVTSSNNMAHAPPRHSLSVGCAEVMQAVSFEMAPRDRL
jgi:hypothetical protein